MLNKDLASWEDWWAHKGTPYKATPTNLGIFSEKAKKKKDKGMNF